MKTLERLKQRSFMKREQDGFTLLELIIVVVVIGVLAAIAIPTFGAITANAEKQGVNATAKQNMSLLLSSHTSDNCMGLRSFEIMGLNSFRSSNEKYITDITVDSAAAEITLTSYMRADMLNPSAYRHVDVIDDSGTSNWMRACLS